MNKSKVYEVYDVISHWFDEHRDKSLEEGEVWSDNGGQMLYHVSLSTAEYETCLLSCGFKVLLHRIQDPQCGEATVWVAQKS